MLNLFLIFPAPAAPPERPSLATPDWRRDPLSHPDLARMDQRALADLQFVPESVTPE